MEFDSGSYSLGYSGEGCKAARSMSDLEDLDQLKLMLEAYLKLDEDKSVKRVINRIKRRIEQIVQDAIL